MKTLIAIDGTEIMVSDCDWLFLVGYNWTYNNSRGYYQCSGRGTWNGKQIHGKRIHWFVAQLMGLEIPEGYQIDHIDKNKLNNQRSNLRAASPRLQTYNTDKHKNNTSGYLGVSFFSKSRIHPWKAKIRLPSGRQKHLGSFKTPEEASEVYQEAKKIRDDIEIKKCLEVTL